MAENTPPSVLRERLKKTKEVNDLLENELAEIREFTMYENQLLLVEQGCSELGDTNRRLQQEVENLNKIVQNQDDILKGVRHKIQEKKNRFSNLKDGATVLTDDRSTDAAGSHTALINEVLSTFDALSIFLENEVAPEEAKKASLGVVENLNITVEGVQNEVSKLRQILESSVEEGARRLSDSVLIQKKIRSRMSLFGSQEIAVQTDVEESSQLISWTSSRTVDLLDVSNVDEGKTVDLLPVGADVKELERRLREIANQCQFLSSANEDLEKLVSYKEAEILKLTELLKTPKSPCPDKKSTFDHDMGYEDETQSCSLQPIVDSYLSSSTLINSTLLATIPEVKETSFDGSFDENNVPNFTSPPSDVRGVLETVSSGLNVDLPQDQGDSALLEKYRVKIADLQKCRDLLSGELEYCMSELDYRNDQIAQLQNTLPAIRYSSAAIVASSDLFKKWNEEIDSLKNVDDESNGHSNDTLKAGRLVNVLNVIQKEIDSFFAVPVNSTDPQGAETSFANMSSMSLANLSSCPQEFCSVSLDASANSGMNDSAVMRLNVGLNKPDQILKDVRNLRESIEMISSDFTREFFSVISKLERVESIILGYSNMDSHIDLSTAGSSKTSSPILLTSYRNVLIEDIREKARLILDLHKSRSDKQCKDSNQLVSAQISDESLVREGGYGRETESVFNNTDSSHVTTTDGGEINLHFMCPTDSKIDTAEQKSFVSPDVMLSPSGEDFSFSEGNSQRSDEPSENITDDQKGFVDRLKSTHSDKTILSAFWKTVNEFNAALQDHGVSSSTTDSEMLTLEKVEAFAKSVIEVLNVVLLRGPSTLSGKVVYDPNCTKLLSLDVTSLIEESPKKKPLQTNNTLLSANRNSIDGNQEEKENSFVDANVALGKVVKNWKKLIHDSNKRIGELLQFKNSIEIKLLEKIADNNNLVLQLKKAQSETETLEAVLKEKSSIIDDLTAVILSKDVQLDMVKSDISLVQEEACQLSHELKSTKENWSLMATDFMKQYQDLSVSIDTFHVEIESLQKEKVELDSQLSLTRNTIEKLSDDLLNKEQLGESLETVGERLAMEIAEKEELENSLRDAKKQCFASESKISELKETILNKNKLIEDFEIVQHEHRCRTANLEHSVAALSKTLQDTRGCWNMLIVSSSAEIDRLETSLRNVKVELGIELSRKPEFENTLHDLENNLSIAEMKVSELETKITSMNENLLEKDQLQHQLRTSLEVVEERLAKKVAEEEELGKNHQDLTERLSTADMKVLDLEREISALNENLNEKVSFIRAVEARESDTNEHLSRIAELQQIVESLTSSLEETQMRWKESNKSSSAEIDHLKVSIKLVEERLAEKEKLESNSENLAGELSIAKKLISDLERELIHTNQVLAEKTNCLEKIEASVADLHERNAELENYNSNLSSSLHLTRENWTKLLKSSSAEIDRLSLLCGSLRYQLTVEALKSKLVQDFEIVPNEHQIRSANLEHSVTTLTKMLENTRNCWNVLIASSSAEIDRLETSLKTVEVKLSIELSKKTELENIFHGVQYKLSTAEMKILDLEKKITSMDEILFEKGQLRTSLEMVEEQLAKKVSEEEELKKIHQDLIERLSTAEMKVSDLESEITALNENLNEKVSLIRDLESHESDKNEHLSRIAELEQIVESRTSALENIQMRWNESTKLSNAEINYLKASLQIVEEQLTEKEKEKLESNSENLADELSIAKKLISDLERELIDTNQVLAEKTNCLEKIEASVADLHERNTELENYNSNLSSSLHSTRENWTKLLKSSSAEIDRLSLLCGSLRYQLTVEGLKCIALSGVSEESSSKLNIAEETVEKQKLGLEELMLVIHDKDNRILQLNAKYDCLSNNFQNLVLNCKESFKKHDQLLKRIQIELATTSLEKDNLSNLLEEQLSRFNELNELLIENDDHLNSVLLEKEKLLSERFTAFDHLEGVVSDLRAQLLDVQDNRKKLILEAKKRIDEMNTSKKRAEVNMMFEIVERRKVSTKLEVAITEMQNLREGLQMNEDIMKSMKNSLSKLHQKLHGEGEALGQTNSLEGNDLSDPQDLIQMIRDIEAELGKLYEAKLSLLSELDDEKASINQLSSELHIALSTIVELEEKIENCQRRPSLINDNQHESSLSSENSASLSKSTGFPNHSVVRRCSSNNEDDLEVTTCNNTVHLEQSVFMSDLMPMERSVFDDNVDPLSMTIRPELAVTPHKMDAGNESTDESEFGTPVAGISPRHIGFGSDEKARIKSFSANVTKNLAYQAAMEENVELQKKMKSYETDLHTIKAKVEESSKQHDHLTQRIVTLQTLIDNVLKMFYDCVPELPMEQNIVNISKDISNLTEAIIKSTGCAHNCLNDSVNMLIALYDSSFNFKDGIASASHKIGAIANDCTALKKEILQCSQFMAFELASKSSSISSIIEENFSSLSRQVTEKNAVIDELKDANETLQSILLTASLEKESIRDQLNNEISRNNSLICSFEEEKKQLETKYDLLREECDDNLIQKNKIESAIFELLRQWNGDEEVLSKDVVQELKLAFGEAVHAKNIMKARMNKPINFMKEFEEILTKNELMEGSVSLLSKECKNFSLKIKENQIESKNLLLYVSSFKNEIEEALRMVVSAVKVWEEKSLQHFIPKKDAGILERRLNECEDLISNYETSISKASSKFSSMAEKVKLLEEDNSSLSAANKALIKDVSDSETKNKELFEKLEELKASNASLSFEMEKLQETVLRLNEKESKLESIRKTLISVVASTVGKPIDLSSSCDDTVGQLANVESLLSKSNDILLSILNLLDAQETSGVMALECLFKQLKSNGVRDAYLCKKKFAEEISGLDSDMRVEELVQLSLVELESKLVSAIMAKENIIISDFQKQYDSQLASKAHQLSQYEEREKYMKVMIEDLTKENEMLEETISHLKTHSDKEDAGNSKCKDSSIILLKKEKQIMDEEIETLNSQISSLSSGAAETVNKFKLLISDLEKILKNFSELLNFEEKVPSHFVDDIVFNLQDVGFPHQLAVITREMFSRLDEMRKLHDGISEKSRRDILEVERLSSCLKDVKSEHEACKERELELVELQKELKTKELSLTKLNASYANLETQLNELSSKDEKIAALCAEKASLEFESEQFRIQIQELQDCRTTLSTKSRNLKLELKSISNELVSIKKEFLTFRNETTAGNMKIQSYLQNLGKQIYDQVEDEKKKVGALEMEASRLHGQISALNEANAKLTNDKRDLETSLANELTDKQLLNERLKQLEDAPARMGHDDKSCPYKEKVQEYKKELWIIRQKYDDERKKFDVMKKNIEEDLAFKSSIIKKLEERNETTVSQFNLRLASSTSSYNQVCKKLEEAEEKISFLRDMNTQDKKRLEKDIDNLNKEMCKLQSVKAFLEGLDIDCDNWQESLPEIKKKLSEYENLQTTLSEMLEKNKELEDECDFMNKQIEFLELRNTEMFKQNIEATESLDKLKKELMENLDLVDKNKQLQEEIGTLKVSESQYIKSLGASQLQLDELKKKLSAVETKNNQLQNAYTLLEANLESRNQKILHYVCEMKNYESMLTEKTKMNQEVRIALEEERSKYADLFLQKSSLENALNSLQKELAECHARLKELGSQLEVAAQVETSLRQVSAERDDALRSYSDLKSKLSIAQQLIRQKTCSVKSLESTNEKLVADKKENEEILKAREKELIAKIEVLTAEASDKAVRITQLESLLEPSQTASLESCKTKISSLESEVASLKKELAKGSAFHMSPKPQHVNVEAVPLSHELSTIPREEFERAYLKLEKREVVLKRLCQRRRQKILEYEALLRDHNIHIPTSQDSL